MAGSQKKTEGGGIPCETMFSDDDFRKLLDRLDLPWAGYRKVRGGVKKRIRRHMEDLGCRDMPAYLALFEQRPDVREQCRQCLLVTISRFFRDRRLWDHLRFRWLPVLKEHYPEGLRAWSAGCAGGEEPYSLAMVWVASAENAEQLPPLRITATDASPECLERARRGIYDSGSLREIPGDLRRRFLAPLPRHRWGIDPHLKAFIDWKPHNLLADPPPAADGAFHLVLLRNNLLTYYRGEPLRAALEGIIQAMAPGGLLVLGSHEHLPEVSLPFTRDDDCPWIYQMASEAS